MDNKSEMIKYDNTLQNLDFNGFGASDLNMFMYFCVAVSGQGEKRIEIPYRALMNSTKWERKNVEDFHEYLKKDYKTKLFSLGFIVDISEDEYQGYALFDWFSANKKKQILTLAVSDRCVQFFNNIKYFTLLDLAIYGRLQSKYTKLLYQHLCQFRKTGWWEVSLENFRALFSVPEAYQNKRIMGDIINPTIKDLSPYMTVKCDPQYDKTKRGQPVYAYKFTFKEVKQKFIEPKKKAIITENNSEVIPKSIGELQENAIDEDKIFANMKKIAPRLVTRDCINIYDTAMENNTDLQDVYSIIDYACEQQTDNLVGYIISIIKKGFSAPMRTSKKKSSSGSSSSSSKNKFEFSEKQNYDIDSLEKELLSN